jgi:type IX secretion system PorP/SprF family membrane protein
MMLSRIGELIFFFAVICSDCMGQAYAPDPGYQSVMMNNPAFSGCKGDGIMRLSYLNHYPGNSYNLHSVYFSYDAYFPSLHGGAGAYLSDDYLGGIINEIRGGLSYAYFLQAGRDLFINAGLSASVVHRGFNFDDAVLPDQIDPRGGISFPAGENLAIAGRTVFDIGTGFLFIYRKLFWGISFNHLAEPDLSGSGIPGDKLRRELQFRFCGEIPVSQAHDLSVMPQVHFVMKEGTVSMGAGSLLKANDLSFNVLFIGDNEKNLNLQTGFAIRLGKTDVFYNYRFNISSQDRLLPSSLIHQAGIALRLIHAEKRNVLKTINFPEL